MLHYVRGWEPGCGSHKCKALRAWSPFCWLYTGRDLQSLPLGCCICCLFPPLRRLLVAGASAKSLLSPCPGSRRPLSLAFCLHCHHSLLEAALLRCSLLSRGSRSFSVLESWRGSTPGSARSSWLPPRTKSCWACQLTITLPYLQFLSLCIRVCLEVG